MSIFSLLLLVGSVFVLWVVLKHLLERSKIDSVARSDTGGSLVPSLQKELEQERFEKLEYSRQLGQLTGKVEELLAKVQDLSLDNSNLKLALEQSQQRYDNVLSAKKSGETRLGAIAENLVPIIQGLPYDATNLKHLGMPVDYVYFSYDEDPCIVFVEVKSGKSKESKRQKLIKKLIQTGRVYYEELRIDENGMSVKRASNNE